MKLEDFKKLTADILANKDNQGKLTEILDTLVTDYTEVSTTHESMQTKLADYDGKIKDLQATNMNLFLRVAQPTPEAGLQTTKELSYETLLSEFGGDK